MFGHRTWALLAIFISLTWSGCGSSSTCTPSCDGKECGDDGCGGVCGECTESDSCNLAGQCVPSNTCTPACDGRLCGDDGCGGSCGVCPEQTPSCNADGQCVEECIPDCSGMNCNGDDGCGGTCYTCDDGRECTTDSCEKGACNISILSGYCLISGKCVVENAPDFENPCHYCSPGDAISDWSPLPDATVCETDGACHAGQCCHVDQACDGKECGDDGCGGTCGECDCGESCQEGACVFTACDELGCGPDGCGGDCGLCFDFPDNSWWTADEESLPYDLAGTQWTPGETAPDFTLTDTNGDSVELYQFYGRPVFVAVLAAWDSPSVDLTGSIEGIWNSYKDQGLMVVVILAEDENQDPPSGAFLDNFAATYGLTCVVLADSTLHVSSSMIEEGFPAVYLIDSEMAVVYDSLADITDDALLAVLPEG